MTLLFADGFEDGALAWNLLSSMALGTGRFGNGLSSAVTGNANAETGFPATAGPIIVGCAVFPVPGNQGGLFGILGGTIGANAHVILARGAGGEINAYRSSIANLLGSSASGVLPANAWSYVELKVNIAQAPGGAVEVRVNGVTVLNLSGLDTQDSSIITAQTLRLGATSSVNPGQGTLWDDVYICDALGTVNNDFLGELTVEHLRPVSDDTAQWLGSDTNSTDNWALVDEAGTYDGADYVGSSTVGQRDLYLPGASARASGSPVLGVLVSAVAMKSDTGTRTVKLNVREGGYGTAQRPTINGTTASVGTGEGGARYQFAKAGRVTGIRYQRHVGGALSPSFRAWNNVGTKVADVSDTQGNVAGFFTVTFPTALTVAAGSTYTFSIGGTLVSVGNFPASVTGTADVTFLSMYGSGTINTWPNTIDSASSYFVEPIFEPLQTVRQSAELGLPTSFGEVNAIFERKGDGSQFTVADINALRMGVEVAS